MDWDGNLRPFIPPPESSLNNFLYNYNYDQHPGMNVKYPAMAAQGALLVPAMHKTIGHGNHQEKKKRLRSDQVESLERSFQEEIKLDPDRKMKLSRDLGLRPRQIAVWFQNRRVRFKAKELERLYHSLKHEFDVVSKEKQKLQEEVTKLKAMIRNEGPPQKQASTSYKEISGKETAESTSVVAIRSSKRNPRSTNHHHWIAECNHLLSAEECNPVSSSPYWAVLN